MKGFLRGSATAMITPFTKDGVDFESFRQMAEYQINAGTDAFVVLGTTGEPATMSETERADLVKCAVETAKGRAKIVVGAGSNSTQRAVQNAREAEKLGADAILCVTPYYNKCTQAGLIAYYGAICGSVDIPVIAYNVPSRTGVTILPETAEALSEMKNFAGIKDAGGNMALTLETLRRVRGKCDVYSGDDLLDLPILCAGGAAVISVVSNLAPQAVKELTSAVFSEQLDRAVRISDALLPLAKACFCEVNPIPVKEGMNLLGFRAGVPRAPLTPLEEEHRAILSEAMKAFGLEVRP